MGKKLKVLQTRLKSGWRWGWRKEKSCGRRLPACLSMATANSAHARHCLVVWFYPRVSFSLCIASPWMTACRLVPRPWITHPAAADARAVGRLGPRPDWKGPAAHLPAPNHPPPTSTASALLSRLLRRVVVRFLPASSRAFFASISGGLPLGGVTSDLACISRRLEQMLKTTPGTRNNGGLRANLYHQQQPGKQWSEEHEREFTTHMFSFFFPCAFCFMVLITIIKLG